MMFSQKLRSPDCITYWAARGGRMMRSCETNTRSFEGIIFHRLPIAGWQKALDLCMDQKALKC